MQEVASSGRKPRWSPWDAARLDDAHLKRSHFKGGDVLHIALADLGLGEVAVLLQHSVDGPAGDLSGSGDNAASAVLALVAVHKQRVAALVKNDAQDGLHRVVRDVLLLRTLHVEDHMTDSVALHKLAKVGASLIVFVDERAVEPTLVLRLFTSVSFRAKLTQQSAALGSCRNRSAR